MKSSLELTIFTLGTSNRTLYDFLELLKVYDVKNLVDVRSFPTSKFFYFKREYLEEALPKIDINYNYLGRELGGFRKGGYEAFTKTESFAEGIKRLEEIGRNLKTTFFCAEKFPWKCHRRWIANELLKRGWNVVHIIEKDKVWIQKCERDK